MVLSRRSGLDPPRSIRRWNILMSVGILKLTVAFFCLAI
jgi:hypothetical protein